jgi:catechol 2,3-dioxygenase-like lactoylglutathione lyase family enzyme
MKRVTGLLWTAAWLAFLAGAIFAMAHHAVAAQRAFFILQSPSTETVPGNVATNFTVTLTYNNASGTINNAVFTNGVSVAPTGQGVTVSLSPLTSPIAPGSTGTLPLTISATASAAAGSYTVAVWSTNVSFTANTPISGVASITNLFVVGGPANSNAFSMALSPTAASGSAGVATNFTSTLTLVDYSSTLAGWVTNGVTVSGPDTADVTASLDNQYAVLTTNFGQTSVTLTINVNASAAPGTYTVTVNGTNNAFTANPTPGVALATHTLTLTSNSIVRVSPPSIQGFTLSGTTLTITGATGVSNWQYMVLASTNLALPLAQWLPVRTNAIGVNGDFNASIALTNTLAPDAQQQFFLLSFSAPPTVATPTFNPAAGAYASEQAVTISSPTSGASIRYTTDGSIPSQTNGMLYTGPVAILGPVVTNLSGTFSNASGVTKLNAIAYKSGLTDSGVFSGIYQIMVPPPETSASPLRGIAHVAYRVTNLAAGRHFWKDYLGFAEPFTVASNIAVIKINDQQYIELYEGPIGPPQYQLVNYGYQVSDATAMRNQLAANGVGVPPSAGTNALGNLSFFSTDLDGHSIEWVQYRTNSLTGQTRGQAMPDTQVFGYIISAGGFTSNSYAVDNSFYITQCGFLPNGTSGLNSHLINVPNSDGFYEHGTYNTLDAPTAGKKSQVDLLNFRGMTIQQSVAILTNRDPSITIDLHLTTKGRYVGNVYDPAGTRVELDDE